MVHGVEEGEVIGKLNYLQGVRPSWRKFIIQRKARSSYVFKKRMGLGKEGSGYPR